MFGFMKKKEEVKKDEFNLVAIADGKVLPLSEVPDPVFSEKMAGEGVAIDIDSNTIVSPASGEIVMIFKTNHGFALRLDNGIELLVHIGIETVALNGEGFKGLAKVGDKVEAGTPIIEINKDFIKEQGCSLLSPVLITNPDITKNIVLNENISATAGNTVVVEYEI